MDYNTDITVYQMVLDRLPFLTDDASTTDLAGRFIYEVMWELNVCFGLEDSLIGIESNYSIAQRSLVADLVALHFLNKNSLDNTGSNSTYIKRAKAGSAEVEYGVSDTNVLDYDSMYSKYVSSAIRRGKTLGCLFSVGENCVLDFIFDGDTLPFITGGKCSD